jgi:hypothetical protein
VSLDGKCENRSESPITCSFFEAIWTFLLRFSHRVPNWHGIGAQGIDCQFSKADVRAMPRSFTRHLRTILRDLLPTGMLKVFEAWNVRVWGSGCLLRMNPTAAMAHTDLWTRGRNGLWITDEERC